MVAEIAELPFLPNGDPEVSCSGLRRRSLLQASSFQVQILLPDGSIKHSACSTYFKIACSTRRAAQYDMVSTTVRWIYLLS